MRFSKIKTEGDAETLARRLFRLPQDVSPARLRTATEKLLVANPLLRKTGAIRKGVLLSVPRIEGFDISADETWSVAEKEVGIVDELRRAVAHATEMVKKTAEHRRDDLDATKALLNRRSLVIRRGSPLETHIKRVRTLEVQRRAAISAKRAFNKKIVTRMEKDLEGFLRS